MYLTDPFWYQFVNFLHVGDRAANSCGQIKGKMTTSQLIGCKYMLLVKMVRQGSRGEAVYSSMSYVLHMHMSTEKIISQGRYYITFYLAFFCYSTYSYHKSFYNKELMRNFMGRKKNKYDSNQFKLYVEILMYLFIWLRSR